MTMNRDVQFATISFVMAIGFFITYSVSDGDQPSGSLSSTEQVHDFGLVRQGVVLRTKFTLINNSDRRIIIDDVIGSCDCSRHELSVRSLDPSQSALLSVEWEIRNKRGSCTTPINVKYHAHGDVQDNLRLAVSAEVEPDYIVEPEDLYFDANKSRSYILNVFPYKSKSVVLKRAYVDRKGFSSELIANQNQVMVTFDPKGWMNDLGMSTGGQSVANLVIETDNKIESNYIVKLYINY